MLPTTHLLAFTLASFALIVVPGPSVLFTVGRALALGRVAGVVNVAGNTLGVYVQVMAVAFGIGALVERSVVVFMIIKFAGAGYLIYLGVQAIRHRRRLAEALEARMQKKSLARLLADGFLVGIGNPKAIVFFAAVLPQFVDRGAGHVHEQMLLLGLVFTVIALICDSAWALTASAARTWFARSPRRLAAVGGTGGLAMIGLGVTVAVTGRADQ